MKIRSLQLKNIGVFEDETIAFPENKEKGKQAEIHILTGQNGTGKTTILQALCDGMGFIEPYYSLWYKIPDRSFTDGNIHKRFIYKNSNSFYSIFLNNNEEINVANSNLGIGKIIKKPKSPFRDSNTDDINNIIFEYNKYRNVEGVEFSVFAYSGYKLVQNEININIGENDAFDPLEKSRHFNKLYGGNDYSLNQWLANTISKRSFARDEGSYEKADLINRNIKNLEQIIEQIIEMPIKFEPVYETGIKIVANVNGKKLDFDLLPDGLRSIISWLGDLIMRMDALKWKDDLPLFEREFILFLDEIEVHLHPYWQRKILPVVQKLFKNAQIFITTHSPFIVNSVDGAFIYELKLDEKGNCHCEKPQISSTAMPIDEVLEEIYEITPQQMYGKPLETEIEDFQTDLSKAYQKTKDFEKTKFLKKAKDLALKSEELRNNVQFELRQLSNSLEEEFKI